MAREELERGETVEGGTRERGEGEGAKARSVKTVNQKTNHASHMPPSFKHQTDEERGAVRRIRMR